MATRPQAATEPRLVFGPDDHGRAVSADEFASAEFIEPWKYEREDGRLIVMAPDGQEHDDYVEPWRETLILYKRLTRPDLVAKVKPDAWIRVDDGRDCIADIAVYLAADQATPPIPDRIPDLVFEIVSPGRESHERDYVTKRAVYERLGVREYVVIDRFQKTVTVFTRTAQGYAERVLTISDTYRSPLLPGLEIALAEVLNP